MRVAVTNVSTVVQDADAARFAAAAHIACTEKFCPAWNSDPTTVVFLPKGTAELPTDWVLVIADNSDQVGALGYHETTKAGLPIGYAFAKTDLEDGTNWEVTASHELFEMLGDPWINMTAEIDHANGQTEFRPFEACDACEDDSFAFPIDLKDGKPPVMMSDFVLPDYFYPNAPKGAQYDFCKHVTEPLQILKNGYTLVLIAGRNDGWQQVTAREAPTSRSAEMVPGGREIFAHSRRARRMKPDKTWQPSER